VNFKYTLSGSKIVTGDNAEIMFNKIFNNMLFSGNLWATWSDKSDSGEIKVSLQSISVLFEIKGASRSFFLKAISECTNEKYSLTRDVDSKRLYMEMLEQCAKEST
jgi:hypothetical protein